MALKIFSSIRWYYIILFLLSIILISTYINCKNSSYLKLDTYVIPKQLVKLNSSSIQRAILVFYPSDQQIYYLPEIRWLYRSWIEMIRYESNQWRTDLIIFTEQYSSSFIELGCSVNKIRENNDEQSQCRVFIYVRLASREINSFTKHQKLYISDSKKEYFHINIPRSILLYNQIRKYQYFDSINIIAEGYPIYSNYDFILKTDIDVFLTRKFSNYIPNKSNTLFVGHGGYSTDFNTRRLGRIARDMGWEYKNWTNIGSTWYGSPHMAYRIANLTLDAMLHLSLNEFALVEREQKLGALLWPDWHYGVLSMYGTHLAINHLKASENLDIQNGEQLLDQSTTNTDQNDIEKNNRLHLHCWHTDQEFSKFQFKADKYKHVLPQTLFNDSSPRGYAMRMAIESRLMSLNQLGQYLREINNKKIGTNIATKFPIN